jgi:hypothetical protein
MCSGVFSGEMELVEGVEIDVGGAGCTQTG